VTVIAILNIIGGSLMVIGGLSMIALGPMLPSGMPAGGLLGGGAIAVGAVLLGLGVLSSIVAYGLLTGKSWAWTLTVVLAIVSIVLNAISLVAGNVGAIVSIAISAVILYYLYRPHVKAYFGKMTPREPSTAAPA
jgi:hypothetical protein